MRVGEVAERAGVNVETFRDHGAAYLARSGREAGESRPSST